MSQDFLGLQRKLKNWYLLNKRELPWRNTADPYLIWISEIILQQTRVVQGYDYYRRFVEAFPDVRSLAEAEEDKVMKLWQGLGYYSRARNLHAAAKTIVKEYGGNFPSEYKDILSLKGIGEYTAAAIISFSFGQPYAVVDGNVYRVLSRLFAIDTPIDSPLGKKQFAELANLVLDKESPGIHNQAMMELGALQCTPVSPKCETCPLSAMCLAYMEGNVLKYPVKEGKSKVKERFFNYLHISCGDYLFIQKRTGNDIWKNLYELPLIETEKELSLEQLQQTELFKELLINAGQVTVKTLGIRLKHVLSHRIIYANFYRIEIENPEHLEKLFLKVHTEELNNYAVSRLVEKYFETIQKRDLFS